MVVSSTEGEEEEGRDRGELDPRSPTPHWKQNNLAYAVEEFGGGEVLSVTDVPYKQPQKFVLFFYFANKFSNLFIVFSWDFRSTVDRTLYGSPENLIHRLFVCIAGNT
jgi:hypothetical protein